MQQHTVKQNKNVTAFLDVLEEVKCSTPFSLNIIQTSAGSKCKFAAHLPELVRFHKNTTTVLLEVFYWCNSSENQSPHRSLFVSSGLQWNDKLKEKDKI